MVPYDGSECLSPFWKIGTVRYRKTRAAALTDPALPPFVARFPWWGGDLQTLRNRLVHREKPLPGTREERLFPLRDGTGDRMMGLLDTPEGGGTGPLVILIHGLTGCDRSAYMIESARFHLARGRRVLRLNLRGAGAAARYASRFYFAGCWPDIAAVLEDMRPEAPGGIFIIGFSLGGSVTLNALPELSPAYGIIGAATVSVPIEPMEAAIRLTERRNALYQWAFLHAMKAAYRRLDILTPKMREEMEEARTILAIDDAVTAPLHGYPDAATYYDRTAGRRMIPAIRDPLLLIHATNDPWIPPAPYLALRDSLPPNVELSLTHDGGHVGYHGTHGPEPWHDLRVEAFLSGLLA